MRLLKSLYLDIIGLFLPGVWIHATLQNIFSLSWMTGVGYVALSDTTAWWGFFVLMTCSFLQFMTRCWLVKWRLRTGKIFTVTSDGGRVGDYIAGMITPCRVVAKIWLYQYGITFAVIAYWLYEYLYHTITLREAAVLIGIIVLFDVITTFVKPNTGV